MLFEVRTVESVSMNLKLHATAFQFPCYKVQLAQIQEPHPSSSTTANTIVAYYSIQICYKQSTHDYQTTSQPISTIEQCELSFHQPEWQILTRKVQKNDKTQKLNKQIIGSLNLYKPEIYLNNLHKETKETKTLKQEFQDVDFRSRNYS